MTTPDKSRLTEGHPDRNADAVMQHLLAGNKRFVSDACVNSSRDAKRREILTGGQSPFVTVLGCSDSRVSPEVLFDAGLGDVFVVRTAGHVVDDAVLGTLEYGVEHLHTPVLLVLGHQSCGALAAARGRNENGGLPGGYVNTLVHTILGGFQPSKIPTEEFAMLRGHVGNTASSLVEKSVGLRQAVESGECTIVGMQYDLNGSVSYVGHAGKLDTSGFPVALG